MALINCPECGKEISSNAKTCPHCGCEITVCPDCNSVYTQQIEACPNCGHVFSRQTQPEKQDKQDEFANNIAKKRKIITVMTYIRAALEIISLLCLLAPALLIETAPSNDAVAYLESLNKTKRLLELSIIAYAIIRFCDKLIEIVFLSNCNILHKICANEMTMHDIIGVQYCKEHEYLLSSEGKKSTSYLFAVNVAYRQEDKSAGKYNFILIAVGIIFAIIEIVSIAVLVYQIYDYSIYCTVWEIKFDVWKSINYAAVVIGVIAFIAEFAAKAVIEQKYFKKMQEWCNANSVAINK